MNIEDIKVGEWYNVPFKVKEIKSGDIHLINGGIKAVCQPSELSVIGEASMPQHVRVDTSNDIDLRSTKDSPLALSNDDIKEFTEWLRQKAESAPKYNPCRKFRRGDKVRSKQVNGRWYSSSDKEYAGYLLTVMGDEGTEDADTVVYVAPNDKTSWTTDPAYLELVAPIEELERYILIHNEIEKYYDVCWKDDDEPDGRTGRTRVRNTYWYHNPPKTYTQQEAKAAAEAECARLNTEWRKEQE